MCKKNMSITCIKSSKLDKLKSFVYKNQTQAVSSPPESILNTSMDAKTLRDIQRKNNESYKLTKSKTPFSYRPQIFSVDRLKSHVTTNIRNFDKNTKNSSVLRSKIYVNENYTDNMYMQRVNETLSDPSMALSHQEDEKEGIRDNFTLFVNRDQNYSDSIPNEFLLKRCSGKNLPKIKNTKVNLVNSYFDIPQRMTKINKSFVKHAVEVEQNINETLEADSVIQDYGHHSQTGFSSSNPLKNNQDSFIVRPNFMNDSQSVNLSPTQNSGKVHLFAIRRDYLLTNS